MSEILVKKYHFEKTAISQKVILAISLISVLLILGWVLWLSCYGLDFTDESFYLVWISNPFIYSASATQFGFIYHPLYKLLNGDIAALRQSNILVTFCLAWTLADIFLKTVFGLQSLQRTSRAVISGSIATAAMVSLVFAGFWLPTPSYNSLALQALLIAATGLLLADKHISRVSVIGWVLIGCGGWLAFMAKPTTAAALGLCSGFYLLFAGKLSFRLAAIAIATAVVLSVLSAYTIDGSIFTFIDRLKGGAEMYRILNGDKTLDRLLRLDDLYLESGAKYFFLGCSAVFFSVAFFSQSKIKWMMHSANILSISFALANIGMIFEFIHKPINFGHFQGLLLLSVPFAAILAGLSQYRLMGISHISRQQWALAIIFLVFPYIFAFGTSNNYWKLIPNSGIFCIFSGLVMLSPISRNRNFPTLLLSLGLAVQLITVWIVNVGIESPYRQPHPLRDNDYNLEIRRSGSTLLLSKGLGQYLTEVVHLAKQAGFKHGTPMIDMTGQSPGILYAIGATNIGQVWTVGGYPGSDTRAITMLKKVACQDLAAAWLLVEPNGPRRISPEILSSFGGNMATDFQTVGTFKTSEGSGGYSEVREQKILMPVRSVDAAIAACKSSRIPQY